MAEAATLRSAKDFESEVVAWDHTRRAANLADLIEAELADLTELSVSAPAAITADAIDHLRGKLSVLLTQVREFSISSSDHLHPNW